MTGASRLAAQPLPGVTGVTGVRPARRYPKRVDKPLTFRSPIAVVVWVVWLLFAVGNWIDLAVQGRDHGSAVAAAILLLATGAVYVTGQRPQIIADDEQQDHDPDDDRRRRAERQRFFHLLRVTP